MSIASRYKNGFLTSFTLFSISILSIPQVQAFESRLNDFNSTYNTAGTQLDTCDTCHTSSFGFNSYGSDYSNVGSFSAIEPIDSDGDGFSNILEILALKFPGDPNDFPPLINQSPVASANGPYSGTVNSPVQFDGSSSYDLDGTIVSYDWDFGDGGNGVGVTPLYTYTIDGLYTATLTVTDDLGATGVATAAVTIGLGNQAPVADPNGPYTGTAGSQVQFDGSGSFDPGGTIISYSWDFGDGSTGIGVNPSHIYSVVGTYNVTLTVMDEVGVSDSSGTTATIGEVVNQPPVANASGPYSGEVGSAVMFDGSASTDADGTIVRYDWDFGDGTTGVDAGPMPSHTYLFGGSFIVTLSVTDNAGATSTDTSIANIGAVANQPPVADANGPYSGTVGFSVQFDGSASYDVDGLIVSYAWDFGDGSSATGMSPTHSYMADGVFTSTLTVTDDAGAMDTATALVAIGMGNLAPTANANGPYTGVVGVPVQFSSSGSFDPEGDALLYLWDAGDGSVGYDPNPIYAYAEVGIYNVTLTVADGVGATDSVLTTVTITTSDVGVQLEIDEFEVDSRYYLGEREPIEIELEVRNLGNSDASAMASVVGAQHGVEIYRETMMVSARIGGDSREFEFPSFRPTALGEIVWTATIEPNIDQVTATTDVQSYINETEEQDD